MSNRKVSVILPTYNESGNIVPLIKEIQKYLKNVPLEILVVDDNSPDGTAQLVKSTFESDSTVRVIVRTKDPSLGRAIGEGVVNASGDIIVVMDTDFNHQPRYLPMMVEALNHFDCVTGSRFVYGGAMDTRSRHLLSWCFNIFVRFATGGQITDNLYGFFAIHTRFLREVNVAEVFYGYGDYFIRLMFFLQHKNLSILQIPAENGKRLTGTGNQAFFSTFLKYTKATLSLRFSRGRLLNARPADLRLIQKHDALPAPTGKSLNA